MGGRLDSMASWQDLLEGRLSVGEAEGLVAEGAKELEELLKSDPGAEERLLEIIGTRVDGEINDVTWDLLDSSLIGYVGINVTQLLEWVFIGLALRDPSRMDLVAKAASPRVENLIRSILGRFGVELEEAWTVWRQLPNDWRTFFREVYHDQIRNTPLIKIRIRKYNGEDLNLEGNPSSFLTLARNLVLTLQLVAIPDVFSPDIVDSFVEEVTKLNKLIAPEEEEEERRPMDEDDLPRVQEDQATPAG